MQSLLDDTHPKIKEIQISLMRKAGISERTMRMRSLSQTVINLSRRAISRTHPEYNKHDVDLFFVRLHYGDDIADRLQTYIDRKSL